MEFPLLGTEPFAVEFANTSYDDGAIDYLASAELVRDWFTEYCGLTGRTLIEVPGRDAERVRAFRDHVHQILAARADGTHPGSDAVAAVNDCAALAQTSVQLRWPLGHAPVQLEQSETGGTTRLLGELATEAIALVTGPSTLSRCEGPGCRMLFVRQHGRRRFCHPNCSQRGRQARYYRRTNQLR